MRYVIALLMMTGPAFASTGAVNKAGCHSHPKHCHSSADIMCKKKKNGKQFCFVPYGNG